MLLAIRECPVDCTHHRDHPAGYDLGPLFVRGPVLDVAVGARSLFQESQRLHEGLHRIRDVIRIEHLNVFEARPASTRRSSSSATPLAALVASTAGAITWSGLGTCAPWSTALATSALGFLGEQRKAHQPETGKKQKLELFHDVPFNLADISARYYGSPRPKSNMKLSFESPRDRFERDSHIGDAVCQLCPTTGAGTQEAQERHKRHKIRSNSVRLVLFVAFFVLLVFRFPPVGTPLTAIG
jgi:hypothetical protein